MASNYSSSSIFFAPSRKSRRARTIRFSDEPTKTSSATCTEQPNSTQHPAEPNAEEILAADLKLATELQREENLLAMQQAAKRRNDLIQAGRNRTGRSCAHGFGLGTRGVACHADRDLVAEQQDQAEAQAVEVKFVDESADNGGRSSSSPQGSPERRTPKNDEQSACSEEEGSTSAGSSCSSTSTSASSSPSSSPSRQQSRRSRVMPPPLGYRLSSGLTDKPHEEEDDNDDCHDPAERTESSPLRPSNHANIHPNQDSNSSGCNQDCSSSSSSCSPATTAPTKSSSSPKAPVPAAPMPPPSILKNRLGTKRPPSMVDLQQCLVPSDSATATPSITPTSASTSTPNNNTNNANNTKQPAWLEALQKEQKLRKSAQDTGKAAEKLLAETLRHDDTNRRRSGMGSFGLPIGWGSSGSPGRSGNGGVPSYDRRSLPTYY